MQFQAIAAGQFTAIDTGAHISMPPERFVAISPDDNLEPELILIDRTAGTNIGNMTANGGLAAAFDGTVVQAATLGAGADNVVSCYVGKTLAAPKVFGQAEVHSSSNQGYWSTNVSTTLNIRGKAGAAPANAADGTVVGTTTFTDGGAAIKTIDSTDLVTAWDHLWVELIDNAAGGTNDARVAELVLYEWGVP